MFKLLKIGQNLAITEFQGETISQNGQYLNVLDVNDKVVASLILEPGYYLASVSVMDKRAEQELAAAEYGRTLRARHERNGHLA